MKYCLKIHDQIKTIDSLGALFYRSGKSTMKELSKGIVSQESRTNESFN